MERKILLAHLAAFVTMLIWGLSFVVSKVVLEFLSPFQVLFWREVLSVATLFLLYPKLFPWQGWRTELLLFLASFTAMTLYQLIENYAVFYTEASNVAVITSTAPFFTVVVAGWFDKRIRFTPSFLVGFVVAMLGISLFTFNGTGVKLSLVGDCLALFAAFTWGFYQVVVKSLSEKRIPQFAMTRRIFEYAVLTLLPFEMAKVSREEIQRAFSPQVLFCLVFLGVFCSALCYVFWNYGIDKLGAVESSVYIYLNPVTTLIGSAILFGERLSAVAIVGAILTILGLAVSNDDVRETVLGRLGRR